MATPLALTRFLKGPLSLKAGGSDAAQAAAVGFGRADARTTLDQDGTDERPARVERFILSAIDPIFSYQRQIVDSLSTWTAEERARRAALVSLPTGGGKTRTGLWFLREQIQARKLGRAIWIAPSAELVQQAVETAKALWTQFPNGPQVRAVVNSLDVQPDRNSITNAMAFVTAQLAAKRLDGVRKFAADCMIFDEAHQAVARTFAAVVRGQLAVPNSRVIGLSATPGRSLPDEEESLSDLFADTLITAPELGNDPVAALRSRGVLAKLEVNRIELPPQWDRVRVSSAKGPALSIDDLALHPARFWATVGTIEGLKAGAKALVFCASLAHCYALAGALESRQVSTAVISHKTPSTRRASLLARFAAGEIPVLLNKTILATGYDCPTLSDVVLATPIRSAILWEQILGRASRGPAVGGKKVGRIWELDDHRKLHGRVLSYARYLGEIWT